MHIFKILFLPLYPYDKIYIFHTSITWTVYPDRMLPLQVLVWPQCSASYGGVRSVVWPTGGGHERMAVVQLAQ